MYARNQYYFVHCASITALQRSTFVILAESIPLRTPPLRKQSSAVLGRCMLLRIFNTIPKLSGTPRPIPFTPTLSKVIVGRFRLLHISSHFQYNTKAFRHASVRKESLAIFNDCIFIRIFNTIPEISDPQARLGTNGVVGGIDYCIFLRIFNTSPKLSRKDVSNAALLIFLFPEEELERGCRAKHARALSQLYKRPLVPKKDNPSQQSQKHFVCLTAVMPVIAIDYDIPTP